MTPRKTAVREKAHVENPAGQPSVFAKCYNFTDARDARAAGVYPFFRPIQENHGNHVVMEGRTLIMAGSNNYLGLAQDPRVIEAARKAIAEHGTSCSGSRFINGTLTLHEELEHRLASFVGREAALCFTTGYQTNLGSIQALLGKQEHVMTDRYNHASIVDGILLSIGLNRDVNMHRYKHNNMEDLEKHLESIPRGEPILIVTDGVFSMEGDIVKLPELKALAEKHGAAVYLDEAHAIGTIGKTGRGTTEHYGSNGLTDLLMCTFSKSFASIGGFVAGDAPVVDYIKHFARPLIFTASMPPANIAAVMATLDIIEREPHHVERLQAIARKMLQGFRDLGYDIGVAETPIIPLIVGPMDKTFALWRAFLDGGVYTNPVVPPATPPNRCLLRTSYMASHTDADLGRILEIAGEAGRKLGITRG
jgi:8-amino-7-oxononanoate synthase